MIHTRIVRSPESPIEQIHISANGESIHNLIQLVNRALNTWDSAPKELKDLGDMITHGYITQDHTYVKIGSGVRTDYYDDKEQRLIHEFIAENGIQAWLDAVNDNSSQTILKRFVPSNPTP